MATAGGLFGMAEGIYNIFSQERQFKYQKDLQKQLFARDDNAVQRRVADLKKAGLNPVLAAGSSAEAGPVVSVNAPQSNIVGNALSKADMMMGLISQKANIAQTLAQIELIELQKSKMASETVGVDLENWRKGHDNSILRDTDMLSTAPGPVKTAGQIAHGFSSLVENVKNELVSRVDRFKKRWFKPSPGSIQDRINKAKRGAK